MPIPNSGISLIEQRMLRKLMLLHVIEDVPIGPTKKGAQRQAILMGSNTVIVLRRLVWPRRTPLAQQRTSP